MRCTCDRDHGEDCHYQNLRSLGSCSGPANVMVHDKRGCVACCQTHAEWRSKQSRLFGHGVDCRRNMKFDDFKIDSTFYTGTGAWTCTDIGTRSVVAVKKSGDAVDGWPYEHRGEIVFTSADFSGCFTTEVEFGEAYPDPDPFPSTPPKAKPPRTYDDPVFLEDWGVTSYEGPLNDPNRVKGAPRVPGTIGKGGTKHGTSVCIGCCEDRPAVDGADDSECLATFCADTEERSMARAKLAAAAPLLLRTLLRLEFSEVPVLGVGRYCQCPSCGRPGSERMGEQPHHPSCALDHMLARAGMVQGKAREVARQAIFAREASHE